MRKVTLSTHLNATPDRVWEEVQTPRLLLFVSHPVLRFMPADPPSLPDTWAPGDYAVRLRLFGIVPFGRQVIGLSYPPPEMASRYIRDNGRSALIQRWDHQITVAPDGDGTRYTDSVEIEAGLMTPIVAAFARRFYAHRQRRWVRLVDAGFDYDKV